MSRISGQAFTQSYVELHKVSKVQFGLLSSEEIRRMSVANISQERIYGDSGTPNFNGVNDPRMGTMDKEMKCFTCKGTQADCPGHFGHIELARPVYHGGLIEFIIKTLRCVCFNCSMLMLPKDKEAECKRIKSNANRFSKVLKICDTVKVCSQEIGGCGRKQPKFQKTGLRIQKVEPNDEPVDQGRDRRQILAPEDALKVFEKIKDNDCLLMGFDPKVSRPENMIIRNLAVAPPPVRPSVAMTNTMRSEDDLTYCYHKIIQTNNQLQNQIQRGANQTTIDELRTNLQYFVATLMDNEIQGQPTQKHKSGKPLKAIRSRLRGKEGRLRGNLMGKRVDYSARTVITPDPILRLDQLGVPKQIALNLTVPEVVTAENIDKMRELISNGPNTWPGAKYIIRNDDRQIDLSQMKNRSDAHLELGYKVERHLRDDDYVIFNRQPSLHKMSLMGHRVKVLPFSTFRLNLSVTTPYNADFDGDEMNMHVPQSYETMAEVKEIMAVPNQIVSPKDNKPVMGIVQDSLLGVMLFTLKDCFIERELVMNLLMWTNYPDDKMPPPAILKPKPLWTGKQIFSLIVPDVNLMKYGEKEANNWTSIEDKNVLIQRGELITGNITKGTIGNSSGGLIHIIWKEKGPYGCRDFLSNTQLLINNWLHQNGFTVGVQDIIARKETIQQIRDYMRKSMAKVQRIMEQAQNGKLKTQPGRTMLESFEAKVNQELNGARDYAGNLALGDLHITNRLKSMVYAGSKGSNLNISQIMACVGQQNVEGKRIPFGFHGRTLPHFAKDDYGPESKGFVESCYLIGLTPQEFYFHAMGGREGLIDTAVKTAETGYIQRRLIKALEDVMVKYDGTVRTSRQQIVQFLYGEDGMAGEYIEDMKINLMSMDNNKCEQAFKFLPNLRSDELQVLLSKSMNSETAQKIISDPQICMELTKEYEQIIQDRNDLRYVILKNQDDSIHLPVNIPRILWNAKEQFNIKPQSKSDLDPSYVLHKLENLFSELAPIPGVFITKDPLILEANKDSTWLFKIYTRQLLGSKQCIQYERLSKQAFDWIIGEIKTRFEAALVNPGEMVGSIGAQSMGEPATQMTLNTFHNAGVSAKNVTLGVPRLKEIINVAKNIKTPSLKIYVQEEFKTQMEQVTRFGGRIEHTTLSKLVKTSSIYYDPDPERTIVRDDRDLVALYYEVPTTDTSSKKKVSSWLLRFELDNEKVQFTDISLQMIEQKLIDNFENQIDVMKSDENAEKLVLRLRVNDIEDEEDDASASQFLREFQDKLLHELTLKGFHEISKVTFTKYNEVIYSQKTGGKMGGKELKPTYMIETDGVALQKVLGLEGIDHTKTISNDIIEILKVLGIEAVRISLINELRFVLSAYGIYVNYRHLSTLCDVMTQRGILTAITRHGINRVEYSGPLRKCSFEETVEILLEAAVFSEIDQLKGITENIIMGQLAPLGTGCFELVIDKDALYENAQVREMAQNEMGGNTPMAENFLDEMDYARTPIAGNTPTYNAGGMTEYSVANTPNPGASFSPNPYGSLSPGYMSPYPQSPGYNNASPVYGGQSPLYQVTRGMQSPAANQSPAYSPTAQNNRMSPAYAGNTFSPAYQSSAIPSAQSPVYRQTLGQSPSYSPTNQASYSPTGQQYSCSPRYSPSTPLYNQQYSPQYSPTSNIYGTSGASPRYQVSSMSPRYQADQSSSHHHSTPQGHSGTQSLYIPASPGYNPQLSSPAYDPSDQRRPTYGSPINDDEEDKQE